MRLDKTSPGLIATYLLAAVISACTTLQQTDEELQSQRFFRLGQRFYGEKDYDKAAEYWKLAAAKGHLAAYSNLGFLTYTGTGVEKDPEEAIRLWRYAAQRGFPEAHRHIGSAYLDGMYLVRDPQEAYARYQTALFLAAKSSASHDRIVAKRAAEGLGKLRSEISQSKIAAAEAQSIMYIQQSLSNTPQ